MRLYRSGVRGIPFAWLLALALVLGPNGLRAHDEDGCDGGHDNEATEEVRELAHQRVEWKDDSGKPHSRPASWVRMKLLGFNDFHGQISTGRRVGVRPVGSGAVLASYLAAATVGFENRTLIVHAGDQVGASPPSSALLQDEPSISFLNFLCNRFCGCQDDHKEQKDEKEGDKGAQEENQEGAERGLDPRCNVIGTLGNHEFDEGTDELLRLLRGGNHPAGPFLEDPYRGANFPYVSSNVIVAATERTLLRPYVVRRVRGMPIALIGAVLKETPTIVTPTGVAGLEFRDEADAINQSVNRIRREERIHTFVVLIHQGGSQGSYTGPTSPQSGAVNGAILEIVQRLDDDVDVVVSGHTHAFTNALVPNRHGKMILVTQAFSSSTAYADIELAIDPSTRDVAEKSASIVTTWADEGPGLTPDPRIAEMTAKAEALVAPLTSQVIGAASTDIVRAQNGAGESPLGDLIADSQRAAMGTDFAVMNPGGIRADITAGEVTWGDLFTVQPFGNSLVKIDLTGQDLYDLLEQQWAGQPFPRILQISGFTYTWDPLLPVGARVLEVRKDGAAIDRAADYSVTMNNFVAAGGDNFTVALRGRNQVGGPIDLDALIAYVGALPQPFTVAIDGRIANP